MLTLGCWWRDLSRDERAVTIVLWLAALAWTAFGTDSRLINLCVAAAGAIIAIIALGLFRQHETA